MAQITREKAPPRLPWESFRREFAELWEPGDHVSLTAPTKAGKSVFAGRGLLPLWNGHTVTFDVKGDGSVHVPGARKVREFPSELRLLGKGRHDYLLSPGYGSGAAAVFDQAMRSIWATLPAYPGAGTWTVYLDELRVLSDKLGMRAHIETFYIAGRSRGITVVGATQAPRHVPSEFYDQATWHIFGPVRDLRTLRRNAEVGGDVERIMAVVPTLDRERHEFYVIGPGYEAITSYKGVTK